MDSPQISDSSLESQYELKKAKKGEYSSLCSTDDELNFQLTPESDKSFPVSRPSVKKSTITINNSNNNTNTEQPKSMEQQQQQEPEQQQQPIMPKTIFGFLERKIELNRANNATKVINNPVNTAQVAAAVTQKKQKDLPITSSIRFFINQHELMQEGEDCESEESNQKKFVVYQIEITEEKRKGTRIVGSESWIFSSRYSMLREMFNSLKSEINNFSNLNLPKFPSRKWFGNMDQQFLSERKRDLQTFLAAMSKSKAVMESKTIQTLLSESREAADEEFRL